MNYSRCNLRKTIKSLLFSATVATLLPFYTNSTNALEFQWNQNTGYKRLRWYQNTAVKNFKNNSVFIGSELAFNLNLNIGDRINLMSSAFVTTPLGSLPKQENFNIAGIFNTGFVEFDQNIIFKSLSFDNPCMVALNC